MKIIDKIRIFIGIILLFSLGVAKVSLAQQYSNFPGVFHIQSTVSDGEYSIEELQTKAKEKGIKVMVLTDSLLRRWEYGLWPLRNLIKRRIEENSVLKSGVRNYFKKVDEVQKDSSNLVILPGVEVSPFYFWRGNPFKKNLSLHNWHQQLVIVGLNKRYYKKLPVVANYSLFPNRLSDLGQLWPIVTIFLGIWLARKKRIRRFLLRGKVYSFYSPLYKYIGYIIVGISIVWLVNNFNFAVSKYDQYHGNQGIKPYQDLIDYVSQKGGAVFWTHPEATYSRNVKGINVYTPAYPQDLVTAHNYTGFASMYQDNITFTNPGDRWDRILIQYCEGKRERPVWGVGEIDYQGPSKQIDTIQTVFLLPQLDKEAVLEALKRGRIYAKSNGQSNDFSLDRFVVSDSISNEFGYMGDEVICKSFPKLYISGSCFSHPETDINIQLIRYGKIIKTFKTKGPNFDIEFKDDYFRPKKKIYYRLNITSAHSRILSNPIFVQFSEK